jgi:hypothetical protein
MRLLLAASGGRGRCGVCEGRVVGGSGGSSMLHGLAAPERGRRGFAVSAAAVTQAAVIGTCAPTALDAALCIFI